MLPLQSQTKREQKKQADGAMLKANQDRRFNLHLREKYKPAP